MALVPKGVGRLYYGSSSGAWPWAAAVPAGSNKHSSSSSNSNSRSRSSHNSEASTNVRFGPPANSESSNTGRNVSDAGKEEGPCDPNPTLTPTPTPTTSRDKRPGAQEQREGVDPNTTSAPSVIRKQHGHEPVVAQTGERPVAETGDKSRSNKIKDYAAEPRDAMDGKEVEVAVAVDEGNEEDERVLAEIEEGVLDVFSDPYCNKHLVYGILELVLVRLMPELAERGVLELWEERLS